MMMSASCALWCIQVRKQRWNSGHFCPVQVSRRASSRCHSSEPSGRKSSSARSPVSVTFSQSRICANQSLSTRPLSTGWPSLRWTFCRQKVPLMEGQPVLRGLDERDWFAQIRDWEKVTETGDRAELDFLPDGSELWQRLDARRETCTGQKCPEFNRCFLTWMHQRAHEADIIIVNHHLFFADLALRKDDFGSILPEYSVVVFDEAHEIEDVASEYFGRRVSNYRFEELARDAEHALRLKGLARPNLLKRVARLRERARSFFEVFPLREGRFGFEQPQREEFLEQNREAYDQFVAALKGLEAEIAALRTKPDEVLAVARRAFELRGELTLLLESSERNYVYWFERRGKGVFLAATPIDVSGIL